MTATIERQASSPMPGRVWRGRWWSVRVDGRGVAVGTALSLMIVAVGCWSISVGDFHIPIGQVVRTLLSRQSDDVEFIVGSLRLPRVLTGVMVGAALALSGAIFQSLAQNPLASPDIVGFDSGAALGAVTMIVLASSSTVLVSIGAMAGGLLTATLVYVCAWKRGVLGYRLILVGIGIGFAVSALSDYLITRANIYDVQSVTVWLTGSLNGRGWEHVRTIGIGLLALMPVALMMCRRLRLLELGPDAAAALGVPVGRTRLTSVLVAVLLAALATASAGPIAFVALISPPIARRLVRSPGMTLLPCALFGGLLTISADLAARRVLAPTELPVGVATAIIGAPYLLWLLSREIRTGAM